MTSDLYEFDLCLFWVVLMVLVDMIRVRSEAQRNLLIYWRDSDENLG